jgi:hypothetical protein
MSSGLPFAAIVLAGDRLPDDPSPLPGLFGALFGTFPDRVSAPILRSVPGVSLIGAVMSALQLLGALFVGELDGRTQRRLP